MTDSDFLLNAEGLVLSEAFRELEVLLEPFNVFAALNIETRETVHSAALRYLMDPAESHGLGDGFLRPLISRMLKDSRGSSDFLSGLALEFNDVQVTCERGVIVDEQAGAIDIFVESAEWVAVIENKVDAAESESQLTIYREYVEREFEDREHLLFFLTPDGRDAQHDDRYRAVGYGTVVEVLMTTFRLHEANLSTPVATFIEHYIETLRRSVLGNGKIASICSDLWKNHRQVLEELMEHRESYRAHAIGLIASCATVQNDYQRFLENYSSAVNLFPNKWKAYTDLLGFQHGGKPLVYFSVFVSTDGDTLTLRLQLDSSGPDDKELKTQLIKIFDENRAGTGDVSGAWTAMSEKLRFTDERKTEFRPFADSEGVEDLLESSLNRAFEEFQPAVDRITQLLERSQ